MKKTRPFMEIQEVSISFNGKPVLENITAGFQRNVVTGVIGPSGSGKSTLLRTLSRMNDRVQGFSVRGKVMVDGEEIYGNGIDVHRLRQKMGMVFQNPCVFPKSIFENVVFGVKHLFPGRKKEFPELVERTLREVILWEEVKDRLHKPAPTLSQGQKQRLAMARTLALDPEVLLMDEPTSALDPRSMQAIEELIGSMKGKRTVVLVTHNMDQARRISQDLIFLCEGRICESGTCSELFANPIHEETRDYLHSRRQISPYPAESSLFPSFDNL